ncbi:E3 SUMO-protein ligase ZBED1-like [Nothobranchius furzeri]|uniref:E3 SUMO-protein ligase ZBED1-like n=1 Tax=Nothobranchius furzeri TaxID=105023 RepID=UPI003904D845
MDMTKNAGLEVVTIGRDSAAMSQVPRRPTSKVWEYFKRSTKRKSAVICCLCTTELAYHTSTTSMWEHLKRRHPIVTRDSREQKAKQRTLSSYLGQEMQCTPQRAAELNKRILKLIVKDMRPLSLVEGDAFIDMVEYACPGFKCPSRWWFTNQLEKTYEDTLENLKKNIKKRSSKVTLTTDAWTSIATEAYLGVTCHYIDDNWEMVSFVLCTKPLEERHTADNIALWIEEVAEKFDFSLRNDVQAIVHDNAANVVKALRILEERHGVSSLRCAGHTTQLIVNQALKHPQISRALGAARELVSYFHNSNFALLKLKAKQEQMGTPQHKLIQDVAVRWNSSFYMITRLLEQRWPVTATLSDPEVTKASKRYLDMKAEQWSLLEELQQALEPFEQATVFLSGEAYVTGSVLPPLVKGLQKSTEKTFDSAPIATFQTTVAAEIASRWKNQTSYDENENVSIFAAALDPRFRKLKFLSTDDVLKVKIKLQSLALEARPVLVKEEPEADVSHQHDAMLKPKSVLHSLLGSDEEELEDDESGREQREDAVRNELLVYFGEKPIPKDRNPLQWWKENEVRFPTLAVVAKSYLGAPATSTASERPTRSYCETGLTVTLVRNHIGAFWMRLHIGDRNKRYSAKLAVHRTYALTASCAEQCPAQMDFNRHRSCDVGGVRMYHAFELPG